MKHYNWNSDKNEKLKSERGVCFEQVIVQIEKGNLREIYSHPDQKKYPNQRILVIQIKEYCYLVPFVENDRGLFLKTIIPSRKATSKYIGEKNEKNKT